MIYGDPFYFSLQFDAVECWNSPDDTWRNGVFTLCLDGKKLFDAVDVFELRTVLSFYSKAPIEQLVVNDLDISADEVYNNAKDYFLGDGEKLIDGLFDMTCVPMEDNRCYLYFIKTSYGDRLIWSTDTGDSINETILPSGTILNVINKLKNCHL